MPGGVEAYLEFHREQIEERHREIVAAQEARLAAMQHEYWIARPDTVTWGRTPVTFEVAEVVEVPEEQRIPQNPEITEPLAVLSGRLLKRKYKRRTR